MLEKIRDYQVISKLGEGGMGTVYLAEDKMLERKVALKVLNPLLTKDPQFTERFRQEAKVQASLIHPNIVSLYNYFREEEYYVMVMEYVEGRTLKEVIAQTGPIPEQRAIWIFSQVLEGVAFANNKGIIHRDIKPSNIILQVNDSVKIMDFGIAKIMEDKGMTKTGTKMGTIYYMSPEQIRAEKDIDQRTDVYSLGVTFYEMLSGKIPFNAETKSDFEIMQEIVSGEIKDPREFYPHISEWVVKLLFASVEKDKEKRIQTTDEFLKKLLTKNGAGEEIPTTREVKLSASTTNVPEEKTLLDVSLQTPKVETFQKEPVFTAPATKKKSPVLILGAAAVIIIGLFVGAYFLFFNKSDNVINDELTNQQNIMMNEDQLKKREIRNVNSNTKELSPVSTGGTRFDRDLSRVRNQNSRALPRVAARR
ncbi:MAG: serine/threonine protein kinase [Ignavibacteriaceae bacterium]|nr:serine/threonine protein kinase [Ignavibacteriaceae bacterium]